MLPKFKKRKKKKRIIYLTINETIQSDFLALFFKYIKIGFALICFAAKEGTKRYRIRINHVTHDAFHKRNLLFFCCPSHRLENN